MDHCSAGSEEWTADSTAPDSDQPSSASGTTGDGRSSPSGSPECLALMTYEASSAETNGSGRATGMNLLAYSQAVSRAKTSASPESEPDSPEPDPASSSNSCESQTSLFSPEDTFWSRTSRVFLVPTGDGTLQPSSGRWPTSGFMTSPGVFSTPNSSEYPNVGAACSSLRDVLEADVAPKYFLSPRAAAGILRRAAKRGKALPEHLRLALEHAATTSRQPTSPESPAQ